MATRIQFVCFAEREGEEHLSNVMCVSGISPQTQDSTALHRTAQHSKAQHGREEGIRV